MLQYLTVSEESNILPGKRFYAIKVLPPQETLQSQWRDILFPVLAPDSITTIAMLIPNLDSIFCPG